MRFSTMRRPSIAVLTATLGLALVAPGSADGASGDTYQPRLEPRTHFTMRPDGSSGAHKTGAGIPNIDSAKSTIATYYGDTGDGTANPTASPYISELHRIEPPSSTTCVLPITKPSSTARSPRSSSMPTTRR